jgi:cytochrome c-type biogenesis protein CcmH/NrfF
LITGFIMIFWFIRRKNKTVTTAIDKEKQEKMRRLLENNAENEDQS